MFSTEIVLYDDVIRWKHFLRYWPFVRGIHRSPVNSPHKGRWCGALMFSLIIVRLVTALWRHCNGIIIAGNSYHQTQLQAKPNLIQVWTFHSWLFSALFNLQSPSHHQEFCFDTVILHTQSKDSIPHNNVASKRENDTIATNITEMSHLIENSVCTRVTNCFSAHKSAIFVFISRVAKQRRA